VATALFGVAARVGGLSLRITKVMNLGFTWLPAPALAAAAAAVLATVGLGLIGTFTALGQKPAPRCCAIFSRLPTEAAPQCRLAVTHIARM